MATITSILTSSKLHQSRSSHDSQRHEGHYSGNAFDNDTRYQAIFGSGSENEAPPILPAFDPQLPVQHTL